MRRSGDQLAPPDFLFCHGYCNISPEIPAQPQLIGDDASILRIALGLAPGRSLTRAIDCQARDVDEAEAGGCEHRSDQTGDATDYIKTNNHLTVERLEVSNQGFDRRRTVRHRTINPNLSCFVDRRGLVNLFGDVDSDPDVHDASRGLGALPFPLRRRHRPTQRSIAKPNQRSRRDGGAGGAACSAIRGSQNSNHTRPAAETRSWQSTIKPSAAASTAA